jgi:predicted O-methyltransferase YrrM
MAYTKAQTTAITQGSSNIENARQKFTALQTQLRTLSATNINQVGTWLSPGAAVMSTAMQALDGQLTTILNNLNNIGQNVGVSASRYNAGMAQEHSDIVSKFTSMLNA